MEITVNGDRRQVPERHTVAELLAELKIPAAGVAVECNLDILSADRFAEAVLKPGDTVEIIRFVGGGCGQRSV